MVIERFAKSSARVVGSGIGGGVGGFLSSPFGLGLLGVTALIAILFIFKDRIAEAIGSFKLPSLPDIQLPSFPDITFPSFDFEFPSFDFEFPSFDFDFPELPPFPELPNLCSLFGIGCEEEEEDFETSPSVEEVLEECNENCSIVQDITGRIITTCECDGQIFQTVGDPTIPPPPPEIPPPPPPEIPPPPPELPPPPPPEIIVDPFLDIPPDVEFEGGGAGFIGGSIGQTPVTTLFQVLGLFPSFSASQAANFLFQFSGILPSEALDLDEFKSFQ